MFRNYLKTAFRNFWKHRTFSIINISGLGLGMCCSLIIMLWVKDEKNKDAFHANGSRLFSVYERQYYDGKIQAGYFTPGILYDEIKRTIPEVKYAVAMSNDDRVTFSSGDMIFKEMGSYAGEDFFNMFSFPLVEGKPETALNSVFSIAISEKMAKKFFGGSSLAMGKTIRYENQKDFQVSAVFADVQDNSTLKFDFVLNWESWLSVNQWARSWGNNGPPTVIQLRSDARPELVERKLKRFLDNYNKEQGPGFRIELGIQRFDEMYLHSHFKDGVIDGGRIEYVRLFSVVAIFILVIACINFMNLTTARSLKRAKEIGVRKVVGALRQTLARQFIGEAMMLTFLSGIISLALTFLLLPVFNDITGKHITLPYQDIMFWLLIGGLMILTGFMSGMYPALFLSSFNPSNALKGGIKLGFRANLFRKGLVVFQFGLASILIIGTIVVSEQVSYVQSQNLGYEKENLVYIPLEGDLIAKYGLFKEKAAALDGVRMVSRISDQPTQIENGTGGVDWEGKAPNTTPMFTQISVGYDFVPTMKLSMVEGRDFSKAYGTDSLGFIINEEALKKIGYKNPIGKPITFWGRKGSIIGVVKNFHFNSLHQPIAPLIIRLNEAEDYGGALVSVAPGKTKKALQGLEPLVTGLNPKFPFSYYFSDEEYLKLYKSEQVVGVLSVCFAFLAIFISCLGLLGLAMFTAEQRTKEIGIRKALGASVTRVFALLSKELLGLVALALLIASPVAWWIMNNWLLNYSYRIHLSAHIFLLAAVVAILIALLTVSFQTVRAAIANPIKSLKSE